MKTLRVLLLFLLYTTGLQSQTATNYVPFTGWGFYKPDFTEVISLREFTRDNHNFYLVVFPYSIDTKVFRSDSVIIKKTSWETISSRYSSSPYLKALHEAGKYSDSIQDAGFTHFSPYQKGIDMTIDLCPSHRPLDRIVFINLIKEMGSVEKPVPIAISITGSWMKRHEGDMKWLDSLGRAGELSIEWINHSYNHYTNSDYPLKSRFLLAPGTDIYSEVLKTEIALLEKDIVPSVFFRFPGLVSDRKIYNQILQLGLIPVGSDAWLAKGQWPKSGSIVLIHANGNDPIGVSDFLRLLKSKHSELLTGNWKLFDLRKSLINSVSK
jgi:hypothetical protein